jgi:hypothetical protein
MQPRGDSGCYRELEREILTQPPFAGGTLTFAGRVSATHSNLLEYVFQSREGPRSVMVKQQDESAESEGLTVRECASLRRVRGLLSPSLARTVPEPLLILPKRGVLVTTKLPGSSLARILKKNANHLSGPFRTGLVREIAGRIGNWLRSFQDATRAEPIPYNAASYLADLELRLSKLQEKGFEPGLAHEILRHASIQCASLNGRLVSAAAKHGDFIPQNILIERDGVAVVDFEGFSEREFMYEDLGTFLGYILVLSARVPYSRQSLNAVRLGFLTGFLAEETIDQALLNTYTLKGAVRIIADGAAFTRNWSGLGATRKLTKRLMHLASEATPA